MMDITIFPGCIIEDNEKKSQYRVLYSAKESVVLCKMGIDNLDIAVQSTAYICDKLINEQLSIFAGKPSMVVDINSLPEQKANSFNNAVSFVREVEQVYAPTFLGLVDHSRKEELIAIYSRYEIPKTTAWRYIRKYLQSGFDCNSLLDARRGVSGKGRNYTVKAGRPRNDGLVQGVLLTPEALSHFAYGLDQLKSGRCRSYRSAYESMCLRHYSRMELTEDGIKPVLFPQSERPSFRQFTYFCHRNLTKEEYDLIKTSRQELRNNKRLLLSDNIFNVVGAGDCVEMDEVEFDISLVSQLDPSKTVGRPIVYVMLDVYTRLIIAVSVAYDNNSILGMTNCLLNLAENKVEFCKHYGITIQENEWPSNFYPKRVRVDRGSEYTSKEAKRIFRELGITLELVPAGTGSFKGSVEQFFHQIQSSMRPAIENHGLIEKRHDSNHHKEATLNIFNFTKMVLEYVNMYNQHYMKDYPLTREMQDKKIMPIPISLYEYSAGKYGIPKPIINKEQFRYSLMTPIAATISRTGIDFKGLSYIDRENLALMQQCYDAGSTRRPFEARIDPRDIGSLYYLSDAKLVEIPLNTEKTRNSGFAGMTLSSYLEYLKEKKNMDRLGEELNCQLHLEALAASNATLGAAIAQHTQPSNAAGMRESRRKERQLVSNQGALLSHIGNSEKTKTAKDPSLITVKSDADDEVFSPIQSGSQESYDSIRAFMDAC